MSFESKDLKSYYQKLLDEDLERLAKFEADQLRPEALALLKKEIQTRSLPYKITTTIKKQVKEKNKKSNLSSLEKKNFDNERSGDFFATDKERNIYLGSFMMIGSVIWLLIGYKFGKIYLYPLFIFIVALFLFFKGIFTSKIISVEEKLNSFEFECALCGTVVGEDDKFCHNCGANLEE